MSCGPTDTRVRRLACGLLVLAALALAPALRTGYLSDDSYTSLLRGQIRVENISIVDKCLWNIKQTMLEGRFFPLAMLHFYVVHYSAPGVIAYKMFEIAGVLLDLALFFVLVRKLSGEDGFALLATSLTISLFQLRAFFDPILAMHGLLQTVVAGMLLSLLALQLFLEGRGRAWLFLGAATYLTCALTYEICYLLVLLHIVVIWRARLDWRSRLEAARPFLRGRLLRADDVVDALAPSRKSSVHF